MSTRIVCATLLAALVTACDGTAQKPTDGPQVLPPAAPASLEAAHQAYLESNWVAMSERIRDVLLDPSSSDLAKANAYALLDKAYAVQNGTLPASYRLSPEVKWISYETHRGATAYAVFHTVHLRGRLRDGSRLKSIKLVRLPGEIVLESNAKLETNKEADGDDFALHSEKLDALPADGVFTLRIEFKDGTSTEGWFIGRALESTASPTFVSPATPYTTSDPNPLVAWGSVFRSPQYLPYEKRTLTMVASHEGGGIAWAFWTGEPGETSSARIGAHEGAPKTKLPPGDYWLSVIAGEERRFGPFRLVRGSEGATQLHVVAN